MLKNNPKEKFILMLQIIERTKKEKTSYGKLLFQENAISHSIIATLKTIALCLNTDNLSLNLNFNLDIFEDRVQH